MVAIALLSTTPSPAAHGQTVALTMRPGLTVNFTIYNGFTSTGKPLGDYDFVNRITGIEGEGYSPTIQRSSTQKENRCSIASLNI